MKLSTAITPLLALAVSARSFALWDDANYGGNRQDEHQPDGPACWNLNGKGDKASSVMSWDNGNPCTTFYRERDCTGASWQQRGRAPTVPDFLNDHIWSFRNQC